MTPSRALRTLILVCLVAVAARAEPRETAPGTWVDVGRVVAVGDVHGTPDKFGALLVATGLTDDELRWTGGAAHLVLVGDLLDRGDRELELLEIVRRLQREAADAGGRVHALLGNHDVMNPIRDLRYVTPAGYAAFADRERPKDRKRIRKRWVKREVEGGREKAVAEQTFDQRFPPGFFARTTAFEHGDELAWLLTLDTVVKIDGVVFVHGGLAPEYAALGVEGVNRAVRDGLDRYLAARGVLEEAGLLEEAAYYRDHRETARGLLQAGEDLSAPVREALAAVVEFAESGLFWGPGPLWHREYARENERYARDNLTASLTALDARAMVVAHTVTRNGSISQRFSGRLFRVDVGMAYGGEPQALVFEDGEARVVDPATGQRTPPYVEPPQGQEPRPDPPAPARVRPMLESGPVIAESTSGGPETRGARLVHIRQDNTSVFAAFWGTDDVANHRRATQELAAHELSGMIGLRLVPLTVTREIDGVAGALQRLRDLAVDGISVAEYGVAPWDAGAIAAQRRRADVFDALIGNCRRPETEILYLHDERRLLLVDHSRAFAISPLAGCGEEAPPPEVPADVLPALRQLDRGWLERAVGRWLSDAQIAAILARRDRLVEGATR